MSGIRKFKREKQAINAHKIIKSKLSFLDVLLGLGITLTITGIILSFKYYNYYLVGRSEGIINTLVGTIPVEKIEAGDTNYKDLSIFCTFLSFIGLAMSGISLIAMYIRKETKHYIKNLHI